MATTTNFGWETPDDTDLVKDGAAAMRTLGNSIDASFVDLKGGTTGQVLAKASNTDLDFTWTADATGIPATIFDAKGDIIAASAADTAARLAVGTNGQYLAADSTTATGLKWVTASTGKLIQIVEATTTTQASGSTSTPFDSNLTATITPTSSSSKIMIWVTQSVYWQNNLSSGPRFSAMSWRLMRGSTDILGSSGQNSIAIENTGQSSNQNMWDYINISYLDSPATTSATTYKTQIANPYAGFVAAQLSSSSQYKSHILLMEIGA